MQYPTPPETEPLPPNEQGNIFLKMQVDALTHARALLEEKNSAKNYTLRETANCLADAERRARYTCGFVHLSQSRETLEFLQWYLEKEQYASFTNEGHLLLTGKGRERASSLEDFPVEIEEQLKKY